MTKPIVAVTIGHKHYPRMMSRAAWDTLVAFADIIHHTGREAASKDDLLALLPEADAWGDSPVPRASCARSRRIRRSVM